MKEYLIIKGRHEDLIREVKKNKIFGSIFYRINFYPVFSINNGFSSSLLF